MPRLRGEVGGQEELDQLGGPVDGVHPGTDGDHVGVVVLPAQSRGLGVVGQHGAHTGNLVGRDLLTVAGTADDDPQ